LKKYENVNFELFMQLQDATPLAVPMMQGNGIILLKRTVIFFLSQHALLENSENKPPDIWLLLSTLQYLVLIP
jgi:hypothetical protein